MDLCVRLANQDDETKIAKLYKTVAGKSGGIARSENEITQRYISGNIKKSLDSGFCLVAEDKEDIIAEIHCYQPEAKVFQHVLSELTVVVHPDFQKQGIGKLLFNTLLGTIEKSRQDIFRVELIARESNTAAIEFYKSLGFKVEGKFEDRIKNHLGSFEADIPMAWFNKHFKK